MRKMTSRLLLLFAREPHREALDKGLAVGAGARLFTAFALGWIEAARRCGARLVVAAPPEDRAPWQRLLPGTALHFLEQRGRSFGERLENSARQAAALGRHLVVVGGDVAPAAAGLAAAFERLEHGADAVIAPARDGGVSLVALNEDDLDLLGRIAPRRSDVFSRLSAGLLARGRRVEVVAPVPDVDGRRRLGSLLRFLPAPLRSAARLALCPPPSGFREPHSLSLLPERTRPSGLRAPPVAA
jgi:glycosyltransferase A (GT-A) superfamily protein (DUF2064 family)